MYPDLKDEVLLKNIRMGDQSAFNRLYDRYWTNLFNYGFSKVGKREVVEDFVQEIFIDLWIKRETLHCYTSISSYLFAAIKYKVINYHKSKIIREKYSTEIQENGENKNSEIEEAVYYNELNNNIRQLVGGFPIQRKKVYQLRFNEEMSYKEIADSLCISVSTVEKHMIKALRQIRNYLTNNGFVTLVKFLLIIC
jgi:RNA polymerase sigma-70 factor (family 1)